MLLSDIFTLLSNSELSQVHIGNTEDGDIALVDQPKVISSINLGMLELYKKFHVLEKEVIIKLVDSRTLYPLKYKYADSNTASLEDKFILDSAALPFSNDVLIVQNVYDEVGDEVFLNNLDEDTSVFTPSNDVLQVLDPVGNALLSLIYRAKPIAIPIHGVDPATYEVDFPEYLLEPLLFYVASRVSPNIGAANGEPTYFQKYLGSCDNIKNLGLDNKDTFTNTSLEKNGWV